MKWPSDGDAKRKASLALGIDGGRPPVLRGGTTGLLRGGGGALGEEMGPRALRAVGDLLQLPVADNVMAGGGDGDAPAAALAQRVAAHAEHVGAFLGADHCGSELIELPALVDDGE